MAVLWAKKFSSSEVSNIWRFTWNVSPILRWSSGAAPPFWIQIWVPVACYIALCGQINGDPFCFGLTYCCVWCQIEKLAQYIILLRSKMQVATHWALTIYCLLLYLVCLFSMWCFKAVWKSVKTSTWFFYCDILCFLKRSHWFRWCNYSFLPSLLNAWNLLTYIIKRFFFMQPSWPNAQEWKRHEICLLLFLRGFKYLPAFQANSDNDYFIELT